MTLAKKRKNKVESDGHERERRRQYGKEYFGSKLQTRYFITNRDQRIMAKDNFIGAIHCPLTMMGSGRYKIFLQGIYCLAKGRDA